MVLTSGFYESEVIEALRGELRPGAVLWDIGANFGLVAVTAARLEGAAQVVAFEPNRTEFRRLARHAAMNRCRIGLANCALSDVSGKMAFQPGPAQNSGMGRLGNDPDPRFGFQEQVPVATGDGLIQDGLQPAPTVVKIDVEGHELRALQGMAHALAHPRCRLVVFEDARDTASPVQALLRELGFEISPLERREATHHPLENLAARKR
ncbi:MAG TPA: FkbM family methyltransferase [Opitutaceae bacterium]|nr:FkbM family methyltransferase [Opitutaceae bacterium]